MKDRLMKGAAVCCALFSVTMMVVIFFYMKTRTIVYASENTLEEKDASFTEKISNLLEVLPTTIDVTYEPELKGIKIPVTDAITEDKFALVPDMINGNLTIYLDGLSEGYYNEQKPSIDPNMISYVGVAHEDGATKLRIQLKSVYEYTIKKENGTLYVKLQRPKEVFDMVVLIDAGHDDEDVGINANGISEKTLIMSVIKKFNDLKKDSKIGFYFTKFASNELSVAEKNNIIALTQADMLISIHAASDEDVSQFGMNAYYNARLYTRGLTGSMLADCLLRNLAESVFGKANGIYEANDNHPVVLNTMVPAVEIEIGHLTNVDEATLLKDEEYQLRIAQGIYNGILEAKSLSDIQ